MEFELNAQQDIALTEDASRSTESVTGVQSRVFTYAELADPETYLYAERRIFELGRKEGGLTEMERSELNSIYPAWFKHFFDPI